MEGVGCGCSQGSFDFSVGVRGTIKRHQVESGARARQPEQFQAESEFCASYKASKGMPKRVGSMMGTIDAPLQPSRGCRLASTMRTSMWRSAGLLAMCSREAFKLEVDSGVRFNGGEQHSAKSFGVLQHVWLRTPFASHLPPYSSPWLLPTTKKSVPTIVGCSVWGVRRILMGV